jgi:glutamate-1-semialdehyde 2,1-aminomutase
VERAQSDSLFGRAKELIPGGVNSPVRAFRAVGGDPLFIDRALGCRIQDVDGNEYVDYVMSWGALLLGHAHPAVVRAIGEAASRGTSYGAPTGCELELAELVVASVPSVEMVRMVSSGTEATMAAVRLARGATGRDLILKFTGCYHGHADSFLVQAGSGVATLGLPDSPGVPAALARLTLTVPFNDVAAVDAVFREQGDAIACVIVEPAVGNGGFIPPTADFLPALRRLTTEYGSLLIFDEVMTGFRVALGGAQERFGVLPDLTTLGKVLGGGMPVAAYGGRRDLMEQMAPAGPIYQAGTLSGNPVGMVAGVAQLLFIREAAPHASLELLGRRLADGLVAEAAALGVPCWGAALGGMWGFHFTEGPVRSFEQARTGDSRLFARFFQACLRRGVYLPPSPFEAAFLSLAHTDEDIDFTLEQMRHALKEAVG